MRNWIGAAACMLTLSACGGEAPADTAGAPATTSAGQAPTAAGAVDACALVTVEDLAAALPGVPFAPPEQSARPGGPGQGTLSTCTYTRSDENGEGASIGELRAALERATTVTVMVWRWPDSSGATGYVQSFVDSGAGPIERLALGDEAIVLGGPMSGVHWRSGSSSASVVVTGRWLDAAARRDIEIALARKAQARL